MTDLKTWIAEQREVFKKSNTVAILNFERVLKALEISDEALKIYGLKFDGAEDAYGNLAREVRRKVREVLE